MVFSYPEFHGKKHEDVVDFLEKLEIACITNHVVIEEQVLKLLKIFLKGDARTWLKAFEAKAGKQVPPRVVTLDRFKGSTIRSFSTH